MLLDSLFKKKRFARRRESSWDRSGGNYDYVAIEAGGSFAAPPLLGPGVIRHLWLTLGEGGTDLYREFELSIRFDSEGEPQVKLPLADFFLFGHGDLVDVNSAPIQVSRQPHALEKPFRGAMNCLFPMPFEASAEISFRNLGDKGARLFFYVDWESHERLEEPALLFHATLNEELTLPPEGEPRQPHGRFDNDLLNPACAGNYAFLDVSGYEGHYVGSSLSVLCESSGFGKWWEGDDMFVIDGEPWPPRLHGTGTEDYFNLAWGVRKTDCRPEYGVTFLEKGPLGSDQIDGRFSLYRFHLNDPIVFERSLLATIEHGHANDCEARYRSVAFWYGRRIAAAEPLMPRASNI